MFGGVQLDNVSQQLSDLFCSERLDQYFDRCVVLWP